MAKSAGVKYVCNACGAVTLSWTGRCQSCGEWNTLTEQLEIDAKNLSLRGKVLSGQSIKKLASAKQKDRLVTGLPDVDSVLGGGLVPGSTTLIAGQPGIGKSTLLLQIAYCVAKNSKVLYVSGEESAHQIGLRAARLGARHDNLELATSTSADDITATIAAKKHQLVIVDSIQTMAVEAISSAPGNVSQITNSAQLIGAAAKNSDTAVVFVGHVTKEGAIAGPKILEHVVDVVLELEGERYGGFKLLRSVKNRFGSSSETGIFEMTDGGLQSVANPSAALLAERQISDGSIVLATMEGSRPLLVEVQALVNPTSFGYPKRTASGIDLNRVNLLVAVLERRTKMTLSERDIYINIVGGIRISEPAADLAVCMAIASAAKGMQLKKNAVVFGEVGLSGEVRHVPNIDKRVNEAKKLGFEGAIGPLIRSGKKPANLLSVRDVRSALNTFLEKD